MKNFNLIAKFPEVVGAVLSDPSGALLDSVGNIDGEVSGAVHAFAARSLAEAGEMLGLGSLMRTTIVGPSKACIITVQEDAVLGVYVDPSKPLAAFEKKLDGALQR